MNGFVLVYVCAMDDIPIGLYATIQEAESVAATLKAENCPITEKAAVLMNRDFSLTTGVWVAEFSNGSLVGWTMIRDFDAEGCDE